MEMEMEDSVPKLPNDLIVEILTYLPPKPLLKFKCVSKSWLSLISSHQFAKSHLLKSKHHSAFCPHRILLNCRGNMKQCSLKSILHDPDTVITDCPIPSAEKIVWVVGSCHGLICLVTNKQKLILWNPTTRNCRELPDMGVETKDSTYVTYGLGFDKCNDDYKVAAFSTWKRKGELSQSDEAEVMVKVYSLKSDEWKRLKNYEGHELMNDAAAFANGKLHWMSSWGDWGWEIVSLDLEREEYGAVQLPSSGDDESSSVDYCRVGAWEECVYLLCSHATSGNVWIMEDDGHGWLKAATIPYNDDCMRYTFKKVLYVAMAEGLLLLHCGNKFVVFDSKDGSFRYPEVRNLNKFAAPAAYVESLVSPIQW